MAVTDATHNHYRELAYRVNDGAEVGLYWNELTNDVIVTVSDERTGASFELGADPARALDVFEHPYAYAYCPSKTLYGVDALLESWAQGPVVCSKLAG